MLQRTETIPAECDTRVVRHSRTVWTQLTHNAWIYFAPHPDTVTILCQNENPTDVTIRGVGKLHIQTGCKGYSVMTILYSSAEAGTTSTRVKGGFLSQVTFQYDCYEELGMQISLSTLSIDLTYQKTVSHLDDFKYASKKVSELLEDVKEQEWKNSHVAYHDTHSVLLFFVLSFVFIYLLYKLYTCIRQRAATWFVRKELPATPIDVSYAAGPNDREAPSTLISETVTTVYN